MNIENKYHHSTTITYFTITIHSIVFALDILFNQVTSQKTKNSIIILTGYRYKLHLFTLEGSKSTLKNDDCNLDKRC